MRIRVAKLQIDPSASFRRRLLAETEISLHIGLRFPDRISRIPTLEVGSDRFHPDFSARFWEETLGTELNELTPECQRPPLHDRFRFA